MKSFLTKMKKADGFTLVELMVVVAIIGLLSAVAVPNFKKYQAKAKISEAKLQLSALYTAEQAFFSDYNMYANCIRYMGYDSSAEITNRYYAVGFPLAVTARNVSAHATALSSGLLEASCPATGAVSAAGETTSYYLAGKGIGSAIINTAALFTGNAAAVAGVCTTANPTGGACVGSQQNTDNMTFQAAAVGIISGDNITTTTASGLTINNTKLIRTVVNGF